MEMGFDMLRWRRQRELGDFRADFLHVDAQAVGAWSSAMVMQLHPLRLHGMLIGGALVDAWVGWVHAGVWPYAPEGTPPEMIEPVHQRDALGGHLGVRAAAARGLTIGADLDRDAWATLEHAAVLDSRASVHATFARGRVTAAARAFTGWSEAFRQDGTITRGPGAGGEARVALSLGKGLTASVVGESAVAGDRWIFRGLAVLTASIGRK
jgi:hypothetical protein